MSKKISVSVIVPVYKVEKYLGKCLDSLLNQTLKDIQIIVVNDGSPDNSQKIIDEYCKEYGDRITALKKENGGLSDARNFGMDHIKGEYYTFLDSDDWVEKDAYEKMYKKAISGNFDMVVCDTNFIYPDRIDRVDSGVKSDAASHEEVKKNYTDIFPAAWNKIFKKKLADTGIRFTKGVWYEDVEYIYKLLPHVENIGTVKKPFIQYLQRENSITYTFNEKIFDIMSNFDRVIAYYKENGLYEKYKKELEYCYVRYAYATLIRRIAKIGDIAVFKKSIVFAQAHVKKQFKHYRYNRHIYSQGGKGLYLLLFCKWVGYIIFYLEKHKRKEKLS